MSKEAMKLALEALESDPITHAGLVSRKQAITALRQALETEPVVCHKDHNKGYEEFEGKCLLCVIDKLMFEIGDLLIKNCTAGERQQEPVAWISEGGDVSRSKRYMDEMGFKCNPLYTAPKQWVGLTDKEHDSIKHNYHNMTWTLEMFAKAIEQALKEKNHG